MGVFVVGCYRPNPAARPTSTGSPLSDLPGATELWPEYGLVQWPGE